jgi:hypothetical protein
MNLLILGIQLSIKYTSVYLGTRAHTIIRDSRQFPAGTMSTASDRKRRSPFGDISPLQLKTHVGMKEGAGAFEKTSAFLNTQAIMMQAARNIRIQNKGGRCYACEGLNPSSSCSFCDRRLCCECKRSCAACSLFFCTLCSTIRWSDQWKDETVTCLSCLST